MAVLALQVVAVAVAIGAQPFSFQIVPRDSSDEALQVQNIQSVCECHNVYMMQACLRQRADEETPLVP